MIKVQVCGSIHEYPSKIEEYGNHVANGGKTVSLFDARKQSRGFFRSGNEEWKSMTFWVILDNSGLAYHVEITRSLHHSILGAAPMSRISDIYTA